MKSNEQLINIVIGQLGGVKKMMNKKKECVDILVQLKAVKSGIDNIIEKIIDNELSSCIDKDNIKKDRKKIKILIRELTKK